MSASIAAHLHRCFALGSHVAPFVLKRAVVAVGLTVKVEADDLEAVGHRVDAVAFDGRRRAHADLGPIEIDVVASRARNHQLPAEAAVVFVQAEQHAAIALVARIAGLGVVGADEHPAAGNHRRSVGIGSQRSRPFDVLAGFRIEVGWQPFLGRHHVARVPLAPLRLIRRRREFKDATRAKDPEAYPRWFHRCPPFMI